MTNYKINENSIIIAPVDKSSKVAIEGFKQTSKTICVGMIDNLDDTFSNPVVEPTPPSKEEQLSKLIVTISSGKRFYADPQSRTDLDGAVLHGFINNAPDTLQENWKTASRPEGADFEIVTFAEMKEASRMALEAKGQIVGVN